MIIGVGTGKGAVELPVGEETTVKAPAPREPKETAPTMIVNASKEAAGRGVVVSPSQAGGQEGPIAGDRPIPPRKGQIKEGADADRVAPGLVSGPDIIAGTAEAQAELGLDPVSATAESKGSEKMSQGGVEALSAQDRKSVDHVAGRVSQVTSTEGLNPDKDQAKDKSAQEMTSNHSSARSNSTSSAYSLSVSTQLPKTGVQSAQPALSLGLSSLAIGLCLTLRGGKKRRKTQDIR